MINPQHIYDFCARMKQYYGAVFVERQTPKGFEISGEYYSRAGRAYYLTLSIYSNRVQIRIKDASKRVVFTDNCTTNINMNGRLHEFIRGSFEASA